jgi:HEAT repeat protein
MITLTLMRLTIAAAALPMLAAAQVQPIPPKQPSAPKLREIPVPPTPPRFLEDLDFKIGPAFELLKEHSLDLMDLKNELHFDSQILKFEHDFAFAHQNELLKEQTQMLKEQVAHLDVDRMTMDAEAIRMDAELLKQSVLSGMPKIEGVFGPFSGDKLPNVIPAAPWATEDPADSLYRVAREALNRGEYRRAAQVFNELVKKYPRSEYAIHSQYYEAFARYRVGGSDDLREALRILDAGRVQFAGLRRGDNVDVQALRQRVLAALAARGDTKAREEIQREAPQSNGSCDREEVSVRAEALSALGQMDPAAAKPSIRKVLLRRDECTVELRRRALYLIGRNPDGDAAAIILDVAKNDPDPNIRSEAMRWLPRIAGDNAIPQLEELMRTTTDENAQRSIVRALSSIDSERSRRAIRSLIERNEVAERVRYEAIYSLSSEKEGRVNPEDIAYLRGLYPKLESTHLKEAVLRSMSRAGTPDSEQFLLAVARNVNEPPSMRAAALQRLGRMTNVSVSDIAKLYDGADARSLREQILQALSQRKEPEAIDKMMEIARKDTDPQIRRYAINLLSRSNNERAKQFIREMIEQ